MLKLFHRSSVLATGARLLAPSSTVASQNERHMSSTKKAVVFSLGGSLVPAMEPVIRKYARDNKTSPAEMMSKLFKDGDKEHLAKIEPELLSRHSTYEVSLAEMIAAIEGIRAEGIKTALISSADGLNENIIPVDRELFDLTSPSLKADVFSKLNVESSDVVYLDNIEANLKTAQSLGMTAIKVDTAEGALRELESSLKVPLKQFIPGFTWIYWDNANNPHKSAKENILYYFLVMYIAVVVSYWTLRNVLKIDGTRQR